MLKNPEGAKYDLQILVSDGGVSVAAEEASSSCLLSARQVRIIISSSHASPPRLVVGITPRDHVSSNLYLYTVA